MTADKSLSVRDDSFPHDLAAQVPILHRSDGESQWRDRVPIHTDQHFRSSRALARPVAYQELDVCLDLETRALWSYMRPLRSPSITPTILHDFLDLHAGITSGSLLEAYGCNRPLQYYIQGSQIPGTYSLGGDLAFMIECVRVGDRDSLRNYAQNCVQVVFNIFTGFDRAVVSIALIEGDALGGGLEAALCCNYIIAERSARFGFPEVLFNCFPGMGAYSFLSRKVGPRLTEEIMQNGKIYTATEMHEMGIVDHLADDRCGKETLMNYITGNTPTYAMRNALCRVRQCVNPVRLDELLQITELWVDMTLRLAPADVNKMERFLSAQRRRMVKRGA